MAGTITLACKVIGVPINPRRYSFLDWKILRLAEALFFQKKENSGLHPGTVQFGIVPLRAGGP